MGKNALESGQRHGETGLGRFLFLSGSAFHHLLAPPAQFITWGCWVFFAPCAQNCICVGVSGLCNLCFVRYRQTGIVITASEGVNAFAYGGTPGLVLVFPLAGQARRPVWFDRIFSYFIHLGSLSKSLEEHGFLNYVTIFLILIISIEDLICKCAPPGKNYPKQPATVMAGEPSKVTAGLRL
jgi:hypothetical protein